MLVPAVTVNADATAYLVNVAVWPGYRFTSAADALGYGHRICDKIASGRAYSRLTGDVKADLGTSDDYQASYLIAQATNELCPALIWQLRNSAGGYRPTTT
nr:DUF732 domain-containing protein [Mycobacterium genavense]